MHTYRQKWRVWADKYRRTETEHYGYELRATGQGENNKDGNIIKDIIKINFLGENYKR